MYRSAYYELKRGGGYSHIYSLYNKHIIFSYNFVLILSGLKYSAGLVPFILHPLINIWIYMHVYTFCRIFHFQNFAQPASLQPSCCTFPKLSLRELNFCVPCVNIVHKKYEQYTIQKHIRICSNIHRFG